jgi:Ser/Thr protein kinase RdoA (MazF antagonist)
MEATALARRFGLDGAVSLSDGPVARGKQGAVWRLDTADGSWAVKTTFEPATEDEVRVSTALQEAAYDAGVPTPGVRRTTDGDVFADVGSSRVRLYTWVDLRGPDLLLDPAQVGEVLAAMHRLPVVDDSTEVEDWFSAPVGPAVWDALVADLRAEGAPFAERLADLRDELVALESWLSPPTVLRTCHRDLWADNLRGTTDGGLCVFDWENSGPADPAQELGCALFEFARSDPGRARALHEAYRVAGGPAALTRRGDFSMLVAQLGHITEIAARDWLRPNPRCPQRSDAEAWIAETLDEPHTRVVLDGLLAAVSPGRV